jgi:NAD(P)-dependent dehydrogenase (short-subunit alcohol dehydrogenase family)
VPNDCLGIPDADIRVMLERNLITAMHMTRAVAPHMIERGNGSIVNIASTAGLIPFNEGAIYAVAKAGVIHWTKCLALELRPHGINVNVISPGPTKTGRFFASRQVAPEFAADSGRLTRLGEPDDIGKACLFFASDLAAFVSGQNLEVSGQGH